MIQNLSHMRAILHTFVSKKLTAVHAHVLGHVLALREGLVIPLVTAMNVLFLDRVHAVTVVLSLVLQGGLHRQRILLVLDRDLVHVRTLKQRMQIETAFYASLLTALVPSYFKNAILFGF